MSYTKAVKHARNVRKQRRQSRMNLGFDTGGGSWPSPHRTEAECACGVLASAVLFDDAGRCPSCQKNLTVADGIALDKWKDPR